MAGTQVAAASPLDIVVRTIQGEQMKEIITKALPPGVSVDRFTRATLTAIQQNPDILSCDRNSLYNAIARCAQDGLMPDGRQAAIVKFNTKVKVHDPQTGKWVETWVAKAQHMPMVEGVIHLLAKAEVWAYAVSVYTNDTIDFWNDEEGQHVTHRPAKFGTPRGERIGAFAMGKTKNGQTYVEAMDMNDLEVPKRATKQKDKDGNLIGPWRDTPDRMEQKSCLHRLAKRIPHAALRDDEEFREENAEPPSEAAVKGGSASPQTSPPSSSGTPSPSPTRGRALQAVVDAMGADPAESAAGDEPEKETKPAAAPEKSSSKPPPTTIEGGEVF